MAFKGKSRGGGLSTLALLMTTPLQAVDTADGGDEAASLDPMVVTATRTAKPVSEVTRSVTVVTEEEVNEQASLDRNLGAILAQTVPGFSPSTEANSNFGQSMRGRNYLVLIDGIPQSTPLRDGFRDLNTIAPSSIERIEVIRGGTAVYGFGATGGIVNVITKEPADEEVAGYSRAGASFSTEHTEDSGVYEIEQRVSGTSGDSDYLLSGSYVERNGRFDSEGRRIPPNPLGSQGGFSDTDEYSLLGKFGHEFDGGDQRIEFMLNHFNNEQDSDHTFGSFSTLGRDPLPNSERTPAIPVEDAVPGSTAIVDPGTENTTGNVTWLHRDVGGSRVRLNTYFGDQSVVYPRFPGFPQGEIESEKFGSRLTVNTPLALGQREAGLVWGVDYLGDETSADRFGPNANSGVPDMDQDAVALFGNVEVPLGDAGLVRGGVRHEDIAVDVDTVVNNNGNTVRGDTLDYSETLFNLSSVFYLGESAELFGSYSQGFSIADLGRVIRDAGPGPGMSNTTFSAGEFESEAEKVDNYELGLRFYRGALEASLVAFYSESDDGATFNPNLEIEKFSETVHGIEASLDYRVTQRTSVGGSFSWAEGESESEDSMEQDLPNTRISPEKLTAYIEYSPWSGWENRLQSLTVGHRDPDTDRFGGGEVEGYTLVGFTSRYEVGPGALRVTLSNLFNEDYYPAVNQAFDAPYAYAKGPGRRLGASYEVEW
jgi:iron complex outermembrane receptor protein